jgi:hypothetical protein
LCYSSDSQPGVRVPLGVRVELTQNYFDERKSYFDERKKAILMKEKKLF